MNYKAEELLPGLFFILVGATYGTISYTSLPMGDALNMGPGYFPIVLSSILALLGLILVVKSKGQSGVEINLAVSWRAVGCLSIAVAIFAFGLGRFGLVPIVFLTVLITCMAVPKASVKNALIIAATVTVFSVLMFYYFIGLPVTLFGDFF